MTEQIGDSYNVRIALSFLIRKFCTCERSPVHIGDRPPSNSVRCGWALLGSLPADETIGSCTSSPCFLAEVLSDGLCF